MMTLKLAQCDWPDTAGPYSFRWLPDGDEYDVDAVITGPARYVEPGDDFHRDDPKWHDVPTGGDGSFQVWLGDDKAEPADLPDGLSIGEFVKQVEIETHAAATIESWIYGVKQVTTLGEVDPSRQALLDVTHGNDRRFQHLMVPGQGIEIHTWMGPEKKTVRKVLEVVLADGSTRHMLVERAWLLGPDGGTIEKICP